MPIMVFTSYENNLFFPQNFGEKVLNLVLVSNKAVFTWFFEEGYMSI